MIWAPCVLEGRKAIVEEQRTTVLMKRARRAEDLNINSTIENEFHITNTAFILDYQLEFSSIAYKVYYHSENYSVYSRSFNFCCKLKG